MLWLATNNFVVPFSHPQSLFPLGLAPARCCRYLPVCFSPLRTYLNDYVRVHAVAKRHKINGKDRRYNNNNAASEQANETQKSVMQKIKNNQRFIIVKSILHFVVFLPFSAPFLSLARSLSLSVYYKCMYKHWIKNKEPKSLCVSASVCAGAWSLCDFFEFNKSQRFAGHKMYLCWEMNIIHLWSHGILPSLYIYIFFFGCINVSVSASSWFNGSHVDWFRFYC